LKKRNIEMRVIIYGFGQMGQKLYHKLKEEEHEIVAVVSAYFPHDILEYMASSLQEVNQEADILIDFSHPDNLEDIISFAERNDSKILLATTGYTLDQLKKIKDLSKNHAVFQSYNTSFGVSMMLKLLKDSVEEFYENHFDIEIIERHHHNKIDAPSGTAKLLYQVMNEKVQELYPVYDRSSSKQKRDPKEVGIQAVRAGTIFGEHSVLFAGTDEIIEISHVALSKEVFVTGAIHAAKILLKKGNGYYTLKNIY